MKVWDLPGYNHWLNVKLKCIWEEKRNVQAKLTNKSSRDIKLNSIPDHLVHL